MNSRPHAPSLRVDVLGPLRVLRGEEPVNVGSVLQRVILGTLALHANRPLGREQLIEAVWGDAAPVYAVNLVQKYVSGLRRALEPDRPGRAPSQLLAWTDAGYLLSLPDGGLDLREFDRGLAQARAARAAGDLDADARSLHAALGLWRGAVLEGLTSPLIDAERDELAERRISALEERIDVDLALGHDHDLVEELRRLTAAQPLRERLRGLLMRALYQTGRQGEALNVFREAREHLQVELGVEPGPELQTLHKRILNGDRELLPAAGQAANPPDPPIPTLVASPAIAMRLPKPAQLPHGLRDFTGRAAELERLTTLARSDQTVMIAAITGTPGIGKTSLAIQWAHSISHQFPDGQLYVNLRGFDPLGSPVPADEVLRGFLGALGVPAQPIPVIVEELAARYRSLLAGRRLLVLLDNARTTEQVRPLLPGTPGCMVVVTSRSQLSGLVATGAVPVTLDLPTDDEAALLFARRIGAERVASEPEAVADVVKACARLPLALAIVAARAARHPEYRLSPLASELRKAKGGLDAFMGESETSDARGVLSWSYYQLSDPAARLFRLLGLHPGSDITAPAAASLAGVPLRAARRLLSELSGAHLVEEHTPGHFTFHDLLRAYAAEQAQEEEPEEERRAATRRVLEHYLHSAHAADRLLYPYRESIEVHPPDPEITVVDFADPDEAKAWFNTEYRAVLQAIAEAGEAGFPALTSQLTWTVTAFLNYQGKWHDWTVALRAALLACQEAGDRSGEALAHRLLSLACLQLGSTTEAGAHARKALDLFGALGNKVREAQLHLDLSRLLEHQADFAAALERARRALALYRAAGNGVGEADALSWIGWYHSQLGRHPEAVRYCHESLRIHRELGDWPGRADTWDALGFAQHHLGDYDEAVVCYERALELWRALGDPYQVATTLFRLGDTHRAAGDAAPARRRWQQARAILDDLEHPNVEQVQSRLEYEGADDATQEG